MYLVKYKAVSSCNELHDFVLYFAGPEDALNTGMLCEKVVVWEDVDLFPKSRHGTRGKRFRSATFREINEFVV